MLMVSDLIELAMGGQSADALTARVPARFQPTTCRAPVVVWNVCRQCNQTCPHCYAAAGSKPSPGTLDTSEGLSLVDDLADSGVKVLIFSGGEPLMRRDLFTLVGHASARGMTPMLSTNGLLLDRRTAERLAEHGVRYVGVSLDGMAAFNDAYRGREGDFDRASRGIREAQRAGMRTGIRMTVTRRNAAELPALLVHATELGVGRFYVSHLVYAGRGRRLVGADLRPAESRELLSQLFRTAEHRLADPDAPRIVTGGNDSDGALLLRWLEGRHGAEAAARVRVALERRGGNSAGEGIVCIDHLGRVHPDQFWRAAVLGDVRTQAFREILAHPMLEALRTRSEHLTGRCRSCAFLSVCRGSHRERAIARFGDPWAPDPSCVLTDAEVDGRTAFPGAHVSTLPLTGGVQ